MADDPKPAKPDKDQAKPADSDKESPSSASLSPAPTVVAGGKNPAPNPSSKIQAEPLADGTIPTVLNVGDTHRKVSKGKTSLTSIYRKADIMTTLLTFVGAIVAGAIILGGYAFFNRGKSAAPTATPKVSQLSSSDLSKLQSFLQGNSAGNAAQVLTINSSSLFTNRVAVSSDLKVVGGLEVGGTTNVGNLNATKTTTLGVTNVGGQLTVNGPLTVQNPALFNAGASFKGNLAATGNGTFGGSISAGTVNTQSLTVSGQLNLDGHINIGGQTPTATAISGVSSNASVQGNDSAGSVNVTVNATPAQPNGAQLVTVNFRTAFPVVPVIVITPVGRASATIEPYITATATGFTINASVLPSISSGTSFAFNYWVTQ